MRGKTFLFWILALSWYSLFLFQRVDLTTSDLGRHLINGRLAIEQHQILHTNFYSYTHPKFAAINHHWGSGVVFFLLCKALGFDGLCFVMGIMSLITFSLFFNLAVEEGGADWALILSALVMPLLAERVEVRPEIFSYLFIAIFLAVLWRFRGGRLSAKWLAILPVIEILWVNLHIYFFFGPALIFFLCIDRLTSFNQPLHARAPISKAHGRTVAPAGLRPGPMVASKTVGARPTTCRADEIDNCRNEEKCFGEVQELREDLGPIWPLAWTLGATIAATLVNPFGLRGSLAPLAIFQNYGYRIVENQSVWFLRRLIKNPNLLYFEWVFGLFLISFVIFVWRRKERMFPSVLLSSLGLMVSGMAWFAWRNATLFGLVMMPAMAFNGARAFQSKGVKKAVNSFGWVVALSIVCVTYLLNSPFVGSRRAGFGLGLVPGCEASGVFFRETEMRGPVFNNYDIGSYLIYELFGRERVFVDNRPEAYPSSFFTDVYVPMQETTAIWKAQLDKHRFNTLFFSHKDFTPWGQEFLIKRIQDPDWAPVFTDPFAIIFLRRVAPNQKLIDRYEISRDHFKVMKLR